jgi:hypothetical protein
MTMTTTKWSWWKVWKKKMKKMNTTLSATAKISIVKNDVAIMQAQYLLCHAVVFRS